ncbi:hypothetical protein G7Y31_06840 [Corynebacterium lizhenjunii]|uniref:YdhG-like domain-containing protein n=1 Tax=Corynebacterium lizhenjunii TaxID=2709394 RepID=A0A7T0P9U2_9CORY|nr:hypothetical protein [Corynebacterium lizhenjunii]QPK78301.1 hypothetical protein G7Y31_06840 [Corynebacterium lizhenjunii]
MNSIDDLTPEQQERYHELADHWEYITGQLDIPYQPISIEPAWFDGDPVTISAVSRNWGPRITFRSFIPAATPNACSEFLLIEDGDFRYTLEIRLNTIGVERGIYLAKKALALFRAEQVGR